MAANATAIWRVRPSGNNNNGGGYDPGIAGAGTDYSQQNSPQVTQSSTAATSTSTTTLTDTGASFTSALIGNGIRVSGTGITTTYTFVTAVPSSTTLTLQTSPGTTGTSVSFNLGGGWADFWTNTTSSGPLVPGNIVYILGSGTPNPSSYTYDYTAVRFSSAVGSTTTGRITYANDPATPGYKAPPDTTGGMPVIKFPDGLFDTSGGAQINVILSGLYFVNSAAANSYCIYDSVISVIGCVCDQFGTDVGFTNSGTPPIALFGCEIFSSVAGSGGSAYAAFAGQIIGCNIHDCVNSGIKAQNSGDAVVNCIIAKNSGDGIFLNLFSSTSFLFVFNCTIDGNTGNGLFVNSSNAIIAGHYFNNIFTNHTGVSKAGIFCNAGTAAQNSVLSFLIDYNTFFNNTANYTAINAGPHDTALGVTPYVASSTENYTLA